MRFEELLDSEQFLIIAQLEPPKGTDTTQLFRYADTLKGRVQAVMVPEMSGAIMRMGSIGTSFLLKQRGLETIVNVNCRDRNRPAIRLGGSGCGDSTVRESRQHKRHRQGIPADEGVGNDIALAAARRGTSRDEAARCRYRGSE